MIINENHDYKPMTLIHALGMIANGDAQELHRAMIVLCNLVAEDRAEISRLKARIEVLEDQAPGPRRLP